MATTYTDNLELGVQTEQDAPDYSLIARNFQIIDSAIDCITEYGTDVIDEED